MSQMSILKKSSYVTLYVMTSMFLFRSGIDFAQGDMASVVHNSPEIMRPSVNEGEGKSSKTKTIALERYQFLKRLEPKFGFFPLHQFYDQAYVALFPIGRSDRVYLLCQGFWQLRPWHGHMVAGDYNEVFYCYQREKGNDNLIYKIDLYVKTKPTKPPTEIRSLRDFLNSRQWGMDRDIRNYQPDISRVNMSASARNDLEVKRDYVLYTHNPVADDLKVVLISDYAREYSGSEDKSVAYTLTVDPVTNKQLSEGVDSHGSTLQGEEFYRKYGLPVAPGELKLLQSPLRKD